MKNKGFTLIEILISSVILVTVVSLVFVTLTAVFNSWRRAQDASVRQQQVRFLFFRLNRELSSLVRGSQFKGDEDSFFFITALMPMAEISYRYSSEGKSVSRFFETSADFDFDTFDREDTAISNIESWEVSYLDTGGAWQDKWDESESSLPKAIKIAFKINENTPEQENIVHIAVAE